MNLLNNDDIELVSVSGKSGSGKSIIASAAALYKVLQEKKYKKIYYITPTYEIGKELGFLPGPSSEKISPFFKSINDILIKLHYLRSTNNKIFIDEKLQELNNKKIEYLPVNYLRGQTLENCFCIVDECQNFSRVEMRSILTRMGENVKVIMTGDSNQIDNQYLNKENNGLNWVVKKCKKENIFAHIQLQGQRSRGKICSLIEKVGL
jgi:PhoH-like ATPase